MFNKNKEYIKMILIDIRLPDVMGYEIVPDLLKIKNIPIIAQSAYAFNTEKDKALQSGCVDYITKPIKPEKLFMILSRYLN